jgi:Spy/CpxP family protein refolding chaperone
MTMKNLYLIIVSLFLLSTTTYGQRGPLRERFQEKKEQIKALKVAFITTELNLSPDEAARFWPIFNAFEEKQQEIKRQKLRSILDRTEGNSIDKLSEKDAASLLSQMENTEEELHQLKKKFVTNLKGVIPSVKILKLKKAEEEFNRKLLQQYREKRDNRR